jgi:hypothetical protein
VDEQFMTNYIFNYSGSWEQGLGYKWFGWTCCERSGTVLLRLVASLAACYNQFVGGEKSSAFFTGYGFFCCCYRSG